MKHSKYSVVIIGSGIAGQYAALKISQNSNLNDGLLLITKSKLGESNSRYAQGGIVAVLEENEKDSISLHVADTLKAGAGLSDANIAEFISESSNNVIKDLLNFGVDFDKNENNEFYLTMEAAHSVNRILHSGGDATGRGIEKALTEKVLKDENIQVYEQTVAVELLIDADKTCKGVIVFNDLTREYEVIHSSAVVIATGGVGQLYKYTTNLSLATGDGVALAYDAGAIIQDMEFVQFHPTALSIESSKKRFLISEAVRGEGAKLVYKNGERFMDKYHELAELAPRDVVTRAIFNEMKEHNLKNVFLNSTHLSKEALIKRFPTISKLCEKNGIDISKDFIPVSPAAHYSMGGIKTNMEGQTSIKGLYAIGEVASTGLHGANRLASNSLLECVVCAYELSNFLTFTNLDSPSQMDKSIKDTIDKYSCELPDEDYDVDGLKEKIQDIMWEYVGILRDEKSLMTAKEKLEELRKDFPIQIKYENKHEYELRNMFVVADLIINCALERKESRGAHYRLDYVQTMEEAVHTQIVKGEKEPKFVK